MQKNIENFGVAVARIYEAAFNPARWPDALAVVAALFGARAAALHSPLLRLCDGGFAHISELNNITEEEFAHWHFADNVLWRDFIAAGCFHEGVVKTSSELRHREALESTTYHRHFLAPNALAEVVFVIVFTGQALHQRATNLVLLKANTDARFLDADRSMMHLLVGHFYRAISAAARLEATHGALPRNYPALERLGIGVMLLGADRQVLFANTAAKCMLTQQTGLRVIPNFGAPPKLPAVVTLGSFHIDCPIGAAALNRVLRESAKPEVAGSNTASTAIRINDSAGNVTCILQIAPFRDVDNAPYIFPRVSAMLFIIDPTTKVTLDSNALRNVYRLTKTELALVEEIVNGHTLQEIGALVGKSDNTVKKHMQNIFKKTNTKRQAELVKVLMLLPQRQGS